MFDPTSVIFLAQSFVKWIDCTLNRKFVLLELVAQKDGFYHGLKYTLSRELEITIQEKRLRYKTGKYSIIVCAICCSWNRSSSSSSCSGIYILIIKITISSIVIGLKNSYFPLIHLPSCYRTVCYWTACYRTVCYRTVQQTNHIQNSSLNQPITFKVVV